MSKGKLLGECITCETEVIDGVNEGVYLAGECDSCERLRYESQSDLLKLARSFRSACSVRIEVLEKEREEPFADVDDIDDQIGHWQALLADCDQAIAAAGETPLTPTE